METHICQDPQAVGKASAEKGAKLIRECLNKKAEVNVALATGTSQFETLSNLLQHDIDWAKVNIFHLDEYIGLSEDHPASFRRYIRERFVSNLLPLNSVTYIRGDAEDLKGEIKRLNHAIARQPIDVAFIGIGENAHLAFNDPPADFRVEDAYIKVKLDAKCRQQQLEEGWFNSLTEVPDYAISMSIRQILKSRHIVCSVPESRKASAVKNAVEGKVSNSCPASALQQHQSCNLYLDGGSASLLGEK